MKHKKQNFMPYFIFMAMLILIMDSKTALSGAFAGVEICLYTVIPSLFPLMVLSIFFTNSMLGRSNRFLSPIGKLCGIPKGSEPILLTGLLGGYPVGAIAVSAAYRANHISKNDANRMLAFCSNCGPAFIFGIGAILFPNKTMLWALWLIHIFSAVITGAILPNKSISVTTLPSKNTQSISTVISTAMHSIATVCCWIVLFKTIANFCQKWFMFLFPVSIQTALYGIMELTNGFISLLNIPDEGTRFIMASCFLSFGGLCVCMQTHSQINDLSMGNYLFGKAMQTCISIILAVLVLFSREAPSNIAPHSLVALFSCVLLAILLYFHKKTIDFSNNNVYNGCIKQTVR